MAELCEQLDAPRGRPRGHDRGRHAASGPRPRRADRGAAGVHLHNTRNTGYANALAALEAGRSCWTPRSAGSAAARTRRGRPATSRPRTWCTCSRARGSRPASTSTRWSGLGVARGLLGPAARRGSVYRAGPGRRHGRPTPLSRPISSSRIAELCAAPRRCARRGAAAAPAWRTRSPSRRERKRDASGTRRRTSAGERLDDAERARLLVPPRPAPTSCTGATGTPAASSRSSQADTVSVGEPSGEQRDQLVAVGDRDRVGARSAGRRSAPARRARSHSFAKRWSFAASDHQLAVLRREDLVRRDEREGRAVPAGDRARAEDSRRGGRRPAPSAVSYSETSITRPCPLRSRSQSAARIPIAAHIARRLVDQRDADAHARAVRLARHADDPGRRLHQRVVARLVARAGRRGRRRRSSSRRAAGCGREAPPAPSPMPLRDARAEALDERRRRGRQAAAARLPASGRWRSSASERLPALAARKIAPSPSQNGGPPLAGLVAALGMLDLHDVGPERGQDLRAVRAGERAGQVEHAEPAASGWNGIP